jgi:hypothetical protein
MDDLLTKLYYDPKTGYIGIQKLFAKAREIDPSIKLKDVKEWYSSQNDIQRFQEQKARFDDFKISSANPDSWQADLAFWGPKPVLTAVNINSRLGYAKLLTNKQATTVLSAIKALVKAHPISIITTDNGSEFMNETVQGFFKKKSISHFNNEPGEHSTMGKIERFNRTIKQRIMKIERRLTKKLLDDVISNYNSTVHRSIGMTPNEAKGQVIVAELNHNKDAMQSLENELAIGSNVLYRLKQKQFGKEAARWSKAVYEIVGFDGYRVQIRSKNNHTLYKSPNDVKLTNNKTSDSTDDTGVFEVEKILDHKKTRNGKYQYLIKWIDVDEPTWESQDNLRLVNKNLQSKLEADYWS